MRSIALVPAVLVGTLALPARASADVPAGGGFAARRADARVSLSQAEAEPAPAPGAASDDELAARTSYLIERLDASKKHATWWYRGWFSVYAGGLAFSTVRASIAQGDLDRADSIVSGVKSTIGIADLLLRPIEARYGADRIRAMPAETEAQRMARLEAAEKQLASNANRASHARDVRVHLSSLGLNLAGASVLLALGSPKRAAISFGIGTVFSELAIFSEPVAPAEDWNDYQARKSTRSWTLMPMGMGLAFQSTF